MNSRELLMALVSQTFNHRQFHIYMNNIGQVWPQFWKNIKKNTIILNLSDYSNVKFKNNTAPLLISLKHKWIVINCLWQWHHKHSMRATFIYIRRIFDKFWNLWKTTLNIWKSPISFLQCSKIWVYLFSSQFERTIQS